VRRKIDDNCLMFLCDVADQRVGGRGRHIMDYYNYINQRQASVHDRHSSSHTGIDVAASPFTLTDGAMGGSGGTRYSGTGVLANCGTAAFAGGQHHLGALANGKLSPGSYERPFTTSAIAQDAGSMDSPKYGGTQQTAANVAVNNDHSRPTTSTPLQAHHQPQRLRYLPPPPGTVLRPLDDDDHDDDVAATTEENDDDGAASVGDGRSSAGSTRSSTSDCHNPAAGSRDGDIQQTMKPDGKDSALSVKADKTSTNTAAAAGATSAEPFIYPWMRRVHSSNNGKRTCRNHHKLKTLLPVVAHFFYNFIYKLHNSR